MRLKQCSFIGTSTVCNCTSHCLTVTVATQAVNAQCKNGFTPLHAAVYKKDLMQSNRRALVGALFAARADPDIRNNAGKNTVL